jgi:hypothetical protein
LLYANFGERRCSHCGEGLILMSSDEIIERLHALAVEAPLTVYAPLVHAVPGSHRSLLDLLVGAFGAKALLIDGARIQSRSEAQKRTTSRCAWRDLDKSPHSRGFVRSSGECHLRQRNYRPANKEMISLDIPAFPGVSPRRKHGLRSYHLCTSTPNVHTAPVKDASAVTARACIRKQLPYAGMACACPTCSPIALQMPESSSARQDCL